MSTDQHHLWQTRTNSMEKAAHGLGVSGVAVLLLGAGTRSVARLGTALVLTAGTLHVVSYYTDYRAALHKKYTNM